MIIFKLLLIAVLLIPLILVGLKLTDDLLDQILKKKKKG